MNRRRDKGRPVVIRRGKQRLAAAGRVVLSLIGVGLVTGCMGWGLVSGWRWLHHSDRFALSDVRITGNERTSRDDLIARGGLAFGSNVVGLDLSASARAIEELPWVRHVRIARELPNIVHVAVQEHDAAALALAGGLYAVSPDGIVFKRAEASERLDKPVLTGFSRDELEQGGSQGSLRLALAILDLYSKHRMHDRAALSELHLDRSSGEPAWTVYLGDEPVEVKLGVVASADPSGVLPDVLGRLTRVWDEIERRGARARSIDLGNRQRPEWIAARLE
jgi:cell division protein FtsQ